MAKVNFKWYVDWVAWWGRSVVTMIDNDDDLTAKAMVKGGKEVLDALFAPFESFPRKISFSTIWSLYEWAKENRDPLEPARNIMDKLKKAYS